MRNLAVAAFVISLAMVAVTIGRKNGNKRPRLATDEQSVRILSSEKIAPHTDQEVVDARCPRDDGRRWELGKPINCEESPNKKYLAKFFYNGMTSPDRYYELFVIHTIDKTLRRIWAGDFRTLGWDWRGNTKIEIRYNCGTGCQAIKTMNINESASIADYKDGRMSEKNGWRITFARSL